MLSQVRHGDVFLKRVAVLPLGASRAETEPDRVVLAYGEVTGHAHAIKSKRVLMWNAGERRYITIDEGEPVLLTHEEHGTIQVPAGTYEVLQQRVYTPAEVRNVAD